MRVPSIFDDGAGPSESAGVLARRIAAAGKTNRLLETIETAISERTDKPTYMIAPPVMGVTDGETNFDRLEINGIPVFEMLSLPPSDLGRRLIHSLETSAEANGIQILHGSAHASGLNRARIDEVLARHKGEEIKIRPQSVVLSTGRFLSGGLKRDGLAMEQLFQLPVEADGQWLEDAYIGNYLGDTPTEKHVLFRSGVAFDENLRPVLKDRKIAAKNLFAAGSILSGYDPAKDGTGMGVSILTGYLAGQEAAQLARVEGSA